MRKTPGADLSYAQLDNAKLMRTNLSKATLHKTDLSQTSLVGANLSEADLEKSNLCKTDLHSCDLSKANLSHSLFNLANAVAANFQDATLTGACITGWNINSATNFKDVSCDYIFKSFDAEDWLPTERRPRDPDKYFAINEFTLLHQALLAAHETIDLTFPEGINWQAFYQSLQGVTEQYPNSNLDLQAIEKQGSAFIIRLDTATDADKKAIESTQKELYETQIKLSEARGELKVFRGELTDVTKQLADKSPIIIGQIEAKPSEKLNPFMTFLGWFQNGQAIIAIIALFIGACSTYFIPKMFPNGFPSVNAKEETKPIPTLQEKSPTGE